MATVPILGTDLHPRDANPNLSPLVEMSHVQWKNFCTVQCNHRQWKSAMRPRGYWNTLNPFVNKVADAWCEQGSHSELHKWEGIFRSHQFERLEKSGKNHKKYWKTQGILDKSY